MARLESCPACGNQTSENASQCPACGEPLSLGWADAVSEKREREEAERGEAERQEEEKAAQRAVVRAAQAQKDKRKRQLVWGSIIVLILGITWIGSHDESPQRKINSAEHQKKIQKLEAQVAEVPASHIYENIRLYRQLLKLNPDNARYADKLAHYLKKEKATGKAGGGILEGATTFDGVPIEPSADIHRKVQGKLQALVALVEYFGYRCDTVSAARPLFMGNGFSLYCNNFNYSYEIEDKGGNWVVTLD